MRSVRHRPHHGLSSRLVNEQLPEDGKGRSLLRRGFALMAGVRGRTASGIQPLFWLRLPEWDEYQPMYVHSGELAHAVRPQTSYRASWLTRCDPRRRIGRAGSRGATPDVVSGELAQPLTTGISLDGSFEGRHPLGARVQSRLDRLESPKETRGYSPCGKTCSPLSPGHNLIHSQRLFQPHNEMAMEKPRMFTGMVAAVALLLLPNVAVAQSIELVEARAMTVGGSSVVTQKDNPTTSTDERPSGAGEQRAASQSGTSTTERRTSLREAARREGYSAAHRRSVARDDVRIGKTDATRSARWQSDVAEH